MHIHTQRQSSEAGKLLTIIGISQTQEHHHLRCTSTWDWECSSWFWLLEGRGFCSLSLFCSHIQNLLSLQVMSYDHNHTLLGHQRVVRVRADIVPVPSAHCQMRARSQRRLSLMARWNDLYCCWAPPRNPQRSAMRRPAVACQTRSRRER